MFCSLFDVMQCERHGNGTGRISLDRPRSSLLRQFIVHFGFNVERLLEIAILPPLFRDDKLRLSRASGCDGANGNTTPGSERQASRVPVPSSQFSQALQRRTMPASKKPGTKVLLLPDFDLDF